LRFPEENYYKAVISKMKNDGHIYYLSTLLLFLGLIGCATLDPCHYYAGKNDDKSIEACSSRINSLNSTFYYFYKKRDLAISYNNRGVAYVNKGLTDLAMKDLNTATELNPDFALPYYNRGRVYFSLRQYAPAFEEFDRAGKFDPKYNIYNSPMVRALLSELQKTNAPICLAIVMGSISNVYDGPQIEQWKEGMRALLIGTQETLYMNILKNDPNFKLVTREETEKILNEQKFQNLGFTSSPVEIGRLIGATHILVIDFSRYSSNKGLQKYEDVETNTLLEVKSGRIISSQVFRRLGT